MDFAIFNGRMIARSSLKAALFSQLLIDQVLLAVEISFLVLMAPFSWIVHPIQLIGSAARHFVNSKSVFDFLGFGSIFSVLCTYFSKVLSLYHYVNLEVDRLEKLYHLKLEIMQSLHQDYHRENNFMPLMNQLQGPAVKAKKFNRIRKRSRVLTRTRLNHARKKQGRSPSSRAKRLEKLISKKSIKNIRAIRIP